MRNRPPYKPNTDKRDRNRRIVSVAKALMNQGIPTKTISKRLCKGYRTITGWKSGRTFKDVKPAQDVIDLFNQLYKETLRGR